MQTFLPYPDFSQSAQCLDRQRLGKQRVEVLQILNALAGQSRGWINHPAVQMWKNHEYALMVYGVAVCAEWINRGYKDTCTFKIEDAYNQNFYLTSSLHNPDWLGGKIHVTHQSNLIQKFPEHYKPIFGNVEENLEYYWPTHEKFEHQILSDST